jgi:uncharacterized protein
MNHTVDHLADNISQTSRREQVQVTTAATTVASTTKAMVLLFVMVTIFSEVVTMFVDVVSGVLIYGVALLALINLAYFSKLRLTRQVYLALTLLPLLRILSLAMPIHQVPPIFQYVLTGVPLLVATFVAIRANGLSSLGLNLTGLEWVYQIIISLSGIPLGVIAALTLVPPPSLVSHTNLLEILLLWIVFTLFGAVTEEVIFRGLVQKALSYSFGAFSVVLSSILYASMFLGTLSPGYVIFYGLTGLLFSIWVHISGSIIGVIMAHSLMNILFLLFTLLFR